MFPYVSSCWYLLFVRLTCLLDTLRSFNYVQASKYTHERCITEKNWCPEPISHIVYQLWRRTSHSDDLIATKFWIRALIFCILPPKSSTRNKRSHVSNKTKFTVYIFGFFQTATISIFCRKKNIYIYIIIN